jgi:alanine dehydrogenase
VELLVLSRAEVEGLLDLGQLLDALRDGFEALTAGEVTAPGRNELTMRDEAFLLGMPGRLRDGIMTVKVVTVFESHDPSHLATIGLYDQRTGACRAFIDGTYITAIRTSAAAAVATDLLAREDARTLAIVGAGVQGEAHLQALTREREWAEIRVWGRREDRARGLAARHQATPFAGVEEAVAGATVVCIATPATEPVLHRDWLAPGAHVNSVGYSTAGRELDPALVRDALVVVESRESALAPPPAGSTDLEEAQDAIELGELVAGRPGRTGSEQLTLYKSVGVALEDDAAAALVLRRAEELGLGTVVEL